MKPILAVIAAMCLMCSGCSLLERVSAEELGAMRARVDQAELELARGQVAVDSLRIAADAAADPAERVKMLTLAANAEIALRDAAKIASHLKSTLAEAEKNSQTSKLELGIAAAWPLILAGIKFIPGAGGVAAPVADIAWNIFRTRKQREDEDKAAGK